MFDMQKKTTWLTWQDITKWMECLTADISKPQVSKPQDSDRNFPVAHKFYLHIGNSVAEMPVKF